jgi:hypothetical protein
MPLSSLSSLWLIVDNINEIAQRKENTSRQECLCCLEGRRRDRIFESFLGGSFVPDTLVVVIAMVDCYLGFHY